MIIGGHSIIYRFADVGDAAGRRKARRLSAAARAAEGDDLKKGEEARPADGEDPEDGQARCEAVTLRPPLT